MLKKPARILFAILLVAATVSVSFMGLTRKYANPLMAVSSPLYSSDPKTLDESDLSSFEEIVGDATVIGLGEGTHGTREFFQMKQRLIQYLVKQKGFTLFSIEAPMPQAALLNAYLIKGEGDPRELIKGMHCWAWNTNEILQLLQWMHDYNQTATHKVIFTGFDLQSPPISYAVNLIQLLQQAGKEKESQLIKSLSLEAEKYELNKADKALGQRLLTEIDRLTSKLQQDQAELRKILEPQAYEDLFQYLRLVKQYLSYHYYSAPEYQTLRDQFMSENILWLQEQHPGAKIIVWAHNLHVFHPEKSPNMGKRLKDKLGDHYRAIGFLSYEGSYRARSNHADQPTMGEFELQRPPEHTLEAELNQLERPLLLLNLRAKEKLPASLQQPIVQRSLIGFKETPLEAQFVDGKDQKQPELKNLSQNYDGMIFIKTTSAASTFPEVMQV